MKITMIAALSIATAVTALPLAAANAGASILFETPSKNIACTGYVAADGKPGVMCEIEHYTWLIPAPRRLPNGRAGQPIHPPSGQRSGRR
jgi:hypothetical protein